MWFTDHSECYALPKRRWHKERVTLLYNTLLLGDGSANGPPWNEETVLATAHRGDYQDGLRVTPQYAPWVDRKRLQENLQVRSETTKKNKMLSRWGVCDYQEGYSKKRSARRCRQHDDSLRSARGLDRDWAFNRLPEEKRHVMVSLLTEIQSSNSYSVSLYIRVTSILVIRKFHMSGT